MSELSFYYGTMESGKTTKLMQDNFNYRKHKIKTVVIKPAIDTKKDNAIVNRRGDLLEVDIILEKDSNVFSEEFYQIYKDCRFILVDEAQFLTKEHVNSLWLLAHALDITVICYGLKSNFKGELFEGSAQLFARSDQKCELTVNCKCGKPAMFNARRVNGKFISDGEEVVIDGVHDSVEYVPLCGDDYIREVVKPPILQRLKENSTKI
ncbi:MAG: thymidine kinase [Bacilli bacterium]